MYGLDDNTIAWVRSYLSGRSQSVIIEGTLSRLLKVNHGVPQGSILGPLLYTLFTNELPEIIHDDLLNLAAQEEDVEQAWPAYKVGDEEDGGSNNESRSQALLAKLKKKAKEKQKSAEHPHRPTETDEVISAQKRLISGQNAVANVFRPN